MIQEMLKEAVIEMEQEHEDDRSILKSFEKIKDTVGLCLTKWKGRSTASERCHVQVSWNRCTLRAMILHIYLTQSESIEDVKRWFRGLQFTKSFKLVVTTDFPELGTYDIRYRDISGANLVLRIWVKDSKVCKFVEDGTEPKYKIACE